MVMVVMVRMPDQGLPTDHDCGGGGDGDGGCDDGGDGGEGCDGGGDCDGGGGVFGS